MGQPPSQLRGWATVETRYVYDSTGRMERAITVSPWTSEDHALMLAWRRYQQSLDTRCGQPIEKAWHPQNDPVHYDTITVTCHACTAKVQAQQPGHEPVKHVIVVDSRDYDEHPLPPFDLNDLDD